MIQLLSGAAPGTLSPELSVRPAKSSPFDLGIFCRSTVQGATFDIEVSPTAKAEDWWTKLATVTCSTATIDFPFFMGIAELYDQVYERIRIRFNGGGIGDAGVVPET